ncbi:MAG: hypothetical protein K6T66_10735 [Peptococcaceae bacterium]|nr:hypothetical protein [Peptococcaceae bacterium]
MNNYVKHPFMVNDLVVYPESRDRARVIDTDCRYELETTPESCTCCTFRFGSLRRPGFQCRHIKALKKVLNGDVKPDYLP